MKFLTCRLFYFYIRINRNRNVQKIKYLSRSFNFIYAGIGKKEDAVYRSVRI